jgi:NAD(P)-dependent dehydrogenase (short-subunit alcohol dehydrogenase family)
MKQRGGGAVLNISSMAGLFLCSPAAGWVSGQVLTVSGGGVQELD